MTGNNTLSSKGKTGEKTVTEYVEYDVDELPYSYFPKANARVFDEIYHGKASVLPSSKSVDLIETLGEGFNSEDLVGQMWKLDPNENGILDRFAFMR